MSKGYSGLFSGTKGDRFSLYDIATAEIILRSPGEYENDYRMFDYIAKRKDIDPNGIIDVVAHGTPNVISVLTQNGIKEIDSRILSHLLGQKRNGKNKKEIRLLSCSTGASPTGFAQNLANKLNTIVYAPTDVLWIRPNGTYFVAPRSKVNPSKPDPIIRGDFVKFKPGGNK